MKFCHAPRRLVLLTVLLSGTLATLPGIAAGQGVSSEQAAAGAMQLMAEGKLPEAAAAFESVVQKYPTSTLVFDAQYRLATLHYLMGDYEKSRALLQRLLASPAPADVMELGGALLPQVLSAKAAREKEEAARTKGFEAAIAAADAFLQAHPASLQVENVVYGRALASFQMGKYEEAASALRANGKQFSRSETILESQYLLALCFLTQGGLLAQETPGAVNPKADAAFDEAQRLLGDIVARRSDLALSNDARFQLGELFVSRALFAPTEARSALFAKGLEAYRSLLPKEAALAAQEERLRALREKRQAALASRNMAEVQRLGALLDHETAKLAALKAKADPAVSARIKVGQLFFHKEAYDEARVALRQMQPFAGEEEQKKNILYYLTLSYARQSRVLPPEARQKLVDKAVAQYNAFQKDYKGDPLADNLPYTLGGLFLAQSPQKAFAYFQESLQLYPKGRLASETLIAEGNACIQLKAFDKAQAIFQGVLNGNPKGELAAAAQFGLGRIWQETGKDDKALEQFQKVLAAYPATPQAESASFWIAQIHLQKGELDTAIRAFSAFLKNAPQSELFPAAKYSLAQGYARKNDPETALRLFREVATDFPHADTAPYAYFEQLALLPGEGKSDERIALMREFLARYPRHEKIYYACNAIAQEQIARGRAAEAAAVYSDFLARQPGNPQAPEALLNLAALWNQQANALGRYFALNEAQRAQWNSAVSQSIATAEKLIAAHSGSAQAPLAVQYLVAGQKLLLEAGLTTGENITEYFQSFAQKFAGTPLVQSRILFALAAFTYEKDKPRALQQMAAAYTPSAIYSPADIDLYGGALLETGKPEEAAKVYKKLAADYPDPDPAHPEKSPAPVQEAQAAALFGIAKAMQMQGQTEGAAAQFEQFKRLYPRSVPGRILEANYAIAVAAHAARRDEKAIPLLVQVFRSHTANVELRAQAMLLHARIQEEKNDLPTAIDQYLKIAMFYDAVPSAASEGLWRGGQLLEKQAASLPTQAAPNAGPGPKEPTQASQLKKAAKAYKDLLAKYPGSPHDSEAKARLAALEPAPK